MRSNLKPLFGHIFIFHEYKFGKINMLFFSFQNLENILMVQVQMTWNFIPKRLLFKKSLAIIEHMGIIRAKNILIRIGLKI